jgi:uncharacterized protein YjiS (DUF1127 family)
MNTMSTMSNAAERAGPVDGKSCTLAVGRATPMRALRQAIQSYLFRRAVKAAEARLRGLDDRLLSDIGIHRSEIKSVLRTAHERKNSVCLPNATMI